MQKSKKIMVLVLVLALMIPSLSFADSHDAEQRLVVDILKATGVITGDEKGNINEDQPLKREELMVILIRMAEEKFDGSFVLPKVASFKDVPTSHWAFEVVEKAKHYKLTSGISEDMFGLGQLVDYKQALAFVTRLIGFNFEWDSMIVEAHRSGFASPEPASGKPFLRGHMFDLAIQAISKVNYETMTIWGDHLASRAEKVNVKYSEFLNSEEKANPYLTGSVVDLAWVPSKIATSKELETRVDATKIEWTPTSNSVLQPLKFFIKLPDGWVGQNMLWDFSYDEDMDTIYVKWDSGMEGAVMTLDLTSVHENDSLEYNGTPVVSYLVSGFANFGVGNEPFRMVIQAKGDEVLNGWLDSISFTTNFGPDVEFIYE